MNFFSALESLLLQHGVTIHVVITKNAHGQVVASVIPKGKITLPPLNFTGTSAEMDAEVVEKMKVAFENVPALITNAETYQQEAEKMQEETKKKEEKKPAAKEKTETPKGGKGKAAQKKAENEQPSLLGEDDDDQNDVDDDEQGEETPQSQENNPEEVNAALSNLPFQEVTMQVKNTGDPDSAYKEIKPGDLIFTIQPAAEETPQSQAGATTADGLPAVLGAEQPEPNKATEPEPVVIPEPEKPEAAAQEPKQEPIDDEADQPVLF